MCLGIPAEVVALSDDRLAKVSVGGVERMVSVDLLLDEDLTPGDWVLVHVGFALSRIDAAEAAITLDQIKKLGSFEEEFDSYKGTVIA